MPSCEKLAPLKRKNGFWMLVAVLTCTILFMMSYLGNPCALSPCIRSASAGPFENVKQVRIPYRSVGFINHTQTQHGEHQTRSSSQFDYNGNDILVFIHIQKTGGSFMEKALTRNLKEVKCKCKTKRSCDCLRPQGKEPWIVCRFTNGGWPCGLHADWTELKVCAPELMNHYYGKNVKRRFLFSTILREPITRYISEFRHVQRGATWKKSRHMCGGKTPNKDELNYCYDGGGWNVQTLQEFSSCPHNFANNRQTRMLADLTLVGCYNQSSMPRHKREQIMLDSAKANLKNMTYFALLEQQLKSQFMFEKTYGLKFLTSFQQFNSGYAQEYLKEIKPEDLKMIEKANNLDIELYRFAKTLFTERFKVLVGKYGSFNETAYLGNTKKFTHVDKKMFRDNLRKNNKTKEWKKRKHRNRKIQKQYNKYGVAIIHDKETLEDGKGKSGRRL